jgi:hypothetical protein
MKTQPRKIKISAEFMPQIRALARAHQLADLKSDCAINRRKRAIEEGNEDNAIVADEQARELVEDLRKAQLMMWEFINTIYPEVDIDSDGKGTGWKLNHVDGVLEESDRHSQIPSLSEILDSIRRD